MTAKKHYKQWLEKLTYIELDMVEELCMPIMTQAEGEITLYQVLISLSSKKNYACTIFQAVNKHAVASTITALCNLGYEEEANKVVMNLVTLCRKRFGKKTQYGSPRML